MSEESTTGDLVERWRCSFQAITSGDFDAAMSVWGPDLVWDVSPMGLGVYQGLGTRRDFWQDWTGAYEEWEAEPEEILDLGHGVTLSVLIQKGHPAGSSGDVRLRYAAVAAWADGMIMRVTNYGDIDDACAGAADLAESRV
jgi:ketosteroid isomerase-like protein